MNPAGFLEANIIYNRKQLVICNCSRPFQQKCRRLQPIPRNLKRLYNSASPMFSRATHAAHGHLLEMKPVKFICQLIVCLK